jgi:threonine synthase
LPYAIELECPKCQKAYPLQNWLEDKCGYRLRIKYDIEARNNDLSKEMFKSDPISHWKFRKFFPVNNPKNELTIGEGNTPLVKSVRLAKKIGLKNLYFKLEHTNPSGSFKDRPISVGASVAYENRSNTLTAASSGNAAASLSSFGAKSGIRTVVFVPERASLSKVAQLATLGATVVRVSGGEDSEGDPSVKLFQEAVKTWNWTPCPSFGPFNPFQFEGTKSLAFEVVEQLHWKVPDFMLCNTGSGGLLSGITEGFKDWKELGWIDKYPKMVAVQPEQCSPVVDAFLKNINPLDFTDFPGFPNTVAGGLADPHPWDGDSALDSLYLTNGHAITVTDEEILNGQRQLASLEGIFGEPSGTAAIGALFKMMDDGTIDSSDAVVVPITGHGLKDPSVVSDAANDAIVCPADIKLLERKLANFSLKS